MSPGLAAALLLLASAAPAGDCGITPYDCALFHVGRHEFAEAIRYLDQRLAAAPRDLKALNLLGIALTGAGRREEANRRFRAALAIDPTFYPALKNLAVNEHDAGRVPAARAHFERVLTLAPTDEIAHVYLAEIDFGARRCPAALEHYAKAGGRIARNPAWALHYGHCLLEAHRVPQAIAVLDHIPAEEFAALFEAGVALGQAGAPAEAARYFAAARKGYGDPYAAGYNQVLMLIDAGDNDGAIRSGQELIAEGTAPGELYNLLSRAYVGAGRIQEAYDALRQATRLEPKAPENYVDLAMICVEHDNFDLGLEIVDIGLGHLADSWVLHLQRGVLLAMKALPAEAEKEFEAARRLAPGQTVPFAALGMVWMESGQADKAVEVLRGEMKRRKDHVLPYIFAMALLRSGVDPAAPAAAEAVEALRASIRAKAEFAPSRAELGRLLFKRDELDPAIHELEKAAALDPGNTQALYFLAQAYRKKGDRARAQELLARVSKVNEQERGDDTSGALRRAVVRIVKEGTTPPTPKPAPEP
jgi:tetratricopeptide (TPR) repeat protein